FAEHFQGELGKQVTETEEEILQKINDSGFDELDITSHISTIFIQIFSDQVIRNLENSFKNSFSAIDQLSNKYSKKNFEITIQFGELTMVIEGKEDALCLRNLEFDFQIKVKTANTNRKRVRNGSKYVLYFNKKENHLDIVTDCVQEIYFEFRNEISELINNVYFLPASRSGLYQALNAFSAVMAELSKSRNFLKSKIEIPNISEPVSDYFLNLSDIGKKSKGKYNEIVETIENDILRGRIIFNEENKKIVFKQNMINEEFELAFTSSMVSEIAPIVAYLKYIINDETGDRIQFFRSIGKPRKKGVGVLFIEEPEAHLHPDVQVKLIDIFTKLVGKNLKIIMTSHSNYIFNKLSNIILDKKLDHNTVCSYLMQSTDQGSTSDLISMKAEEDGMNDNNFANTAEMLYEERIRIYDKLNATKNAH
ncbi:MAG: AAA family ATPase, partial [Flavipsychrobacter sp.]|nr:AAA family ATPase [Flavipsychrobacter sp.]